MLKSFIISLGIFAAAAVSVAALAGLGWVLYTFCGGLVAVAVMWSIAFFGVIFSAVHRERSRP